MKLRFFIQHVESLEGFEAINLTPQKPADLSSVFMVSFGFRDVAQCWNEVDIFVKGMAIGQLFVSHSDVYDCQHKKFQMNLTIKFWKNWIRDILCRNAHKYSLKTLNGSTQENELTKNVIWHRLKPSTQPHVKWKRHETFQLEICSSEILEFNEFHDVSYVQQTRISYQYSRHGMFLLITIME